MISSSCAPRPVAAASGRRAPAPRYLGADREPKDEANADQNLISVTQASGHVELTQNLSNVQIAANMLTGKMLSHDPKVQTR